jgi:hypothetical protein
MSRYSRLCFVLSTISILAGPMALDVRASDILDIRGFGGWAVGHTNNDNIYPDSPVPIAANELQYDNAYFTLNLLAKPTEKISIHAQPTWQSSMRGQEVSLDLAYVELTLIKDLRLRAGKIRNPLGLYTDIYKVGTLRPFYLLPNSYYRLAPESYVGIGANRVQRFGSWELELDVLGGQMDFPLSEADVVVGFDETTMTYQYGSVPIAARGKDVIGGGALLRTPIEGLKVGASAYSMRLYGSVAGAPQAKLSDDREKAYAGQVEYLTDKISLRSEVLFTRGYEDDDTAYVEAAYKLTPHWQLAGTFEYLHFKKPAAPVETLDKHRALGAALNYWVNTNVVFKLDYYRVEYNRAARPEDAVNRALAGTLPKTTDVIIGGVQFAF